MLGAALPVGGKIREPLLVFFRPNLGGIKRAKNKRKGARHAEKLQRGKIIPVQAACPAPESEALTRGLPKFFV